MGYLPVQDYGIIGNMRSAALIGINGSIDWFCFPNFDSPSHFASLLDEIKGGFFSISPVRDEYKSKQFYWPDTNVLITRFSFEGGIVDLTDFMPVGPNVKKETDYMIVRRIKGVHGRVRMKLECKPAFNYALDNHSLELTKKGAVFESKDLTMALSSNFNLKAKGKKNEVYTEFEIGEEETVVFVWHKILKKGDVMTFSIEEADASFVETIHFWRNWLMKSQYKGRWREMVNRSALILKLLTFEPTGAIVAAPTCSLPEIIGGNRNWDYRYTWIRDAAFTVYALMRIGFTEEAASFMNWIVERCHESSDSGSLHIMYGIDGRSDLTEVTLDHLEGYRQSGPVRIGNGAYNQLQLDIYGELMDSAYLYNKYGSPITHGTWTAISKTVDWVCRNWQKEDEGIWEVRGGKHHFTYSKMMCWVALDRAIRLSIQRSLPADIDHWRQVRDNIYNDIIHKGWSDERQAFTQYYGSQTLDASTLMMPLVFFMSPTDPLMIKTLDAIVLPPSKGGLMSNSLVYRYNTKLSYDGFSGHDGTFNICTFWLVEALTRAGKNDHQKLDLARLIFEQMLGYSNHLGIFSEEIGISGEALGNTPQAFTHLALISAAFNLDKELDLP